MARKNSTLAVFYSSWKEYQDRIRDAIAPLTPEQLELRATPGVRSIEQIARHMIGARVRWIGDFLQEEMAKEVSPLRRWDARGARSRTAEELVRGLDASWKLMSDAMNRWSAKDMEQTFVEVDEGKRYDIPRSWVIWHLIEHDLHHGGEISLTLGAHGLRAPDI